MMKNMNINHFNLEYNNRLKLELEEKKDYIYLGRSSKEHEEAYLIKGHLIKVVINDDNSTIQSIEFIDKVEVK